MSQESTSQAKNTPPTALCVCASVCVCVWTQPHVYACTKLNIKSSILNCVCYSCFCTCTLTCMCLIICVYLCVCAYVACQLFFLFSGCCCRAGFSCCVCSLGFLSCVCIPYTCPRVITQTHTHIRTHTLNRGTHSSHVNTYLLIK